METRKIKSLVFAQLDWFAASARDLPWRRTRDPYAIWVSEIMLQQTQVKTVIPYWERWMQALPTIAAAAEAPADQIHKLWEGLGYYTRVRNLQKAAQVIVARHGGKFPESFDEVLDLPGIGRYTAGAICSIAFNQPTPILDGNVIRVLTRVFAIAENPKEKATNARLWELAEALVKQSVISPPGSPLINGGSLDDGGLPKHRRAPVHGRRDVETEKWLANAKKLAKTKAIGGMIPEKYHAGSVFGVPAPGTGALRPLGHHASDEALTQLSGRGNLSLLTSAATRKGLSERTPRAQSPEPRASFLNQSLMELGALICTPRQPQCLLCPVQKLCAAFRQQRTEELPNLGERIASTNREFMAFVLEHNGQVLVRQRPAGVVNAHLWEFPNLEHSGQNPDPAAVFNELFGAKPPAIQPLQVVKHSITRYRITLSAHQARVTKRPAKGAGEWVKLDQLAALAFTAAHKKLASAAVRSILSDR